MGRILILFASFDGQTERIARRIGETLAKGAHEVAIRSCTAKDAAPELARSDAVIVGSAVRYGRHVRRLERCVRELRPAIDARPNAFFSVSLSAGGPAPKRAEAERCVREFRERTGWQAQAVEMFAGALRYREYNPFTRMMMRMIVRAAGGDTDTSRDYEYTDWNAVDRFAASFERRLQPLAAA